MWLRSSRMTSWPGRVQTFTAIWLPMVPLGTNRAASFPRSAAADSSRRRTVGSSRNTSSPTSAPDIARRIDSVGRVTVSDRTSTKGGVVSRAGAMASILTGRYPKSHGARGLFSTLSSANLTLAEILSERGYDTAAFVSNLFLRPGQGFEQGFATYDNPQARWDGDSAGSISSAALDWL